ncbi:MAG: sodium-translocating pyrophosphatase [Candidatus Gastranaerophilaceae bacterium]|jgi:K(+)-stimulated pyrophosphate-energized sodium pump
MNEIIIERIFIFIFSCSALSIITSLWLKHGILKENVGTDKMQEIASYIRQGAKAYLKRQYKVIFIVAIVFFLIIFTIFLIKKNILFAASISVSYLIGAFLSGFAGYNGMMTSTQANVRTTEAARESVSKAFNIAIKGGSVTGLIVTGLALGGLAAIFFVCSKSLSFNVADSIKILIGMSFGASLISVFARLGGGIFTKAADIGADLVGKFEKKIPEDDPRNPGVIADNVGDNVGDCAGMAADLFETYVVTITASMLLGSISFHDVRIVVYPLLLASLSSITTVIGILSIKLNDKKTIERSIYDYSAIAAVLAIFTFYFMSRFIFPNGFISINGLHYNFLSLFLAATTGIFITILMIAATEYYTSKRFNPVKSIAKASVSGHATNIITGLAVGMRSTAFPVIIIASGILLSYIACGLYGISIAAVSMISMSGIIISMDAFGPITDNAGGIAVMSELDEKTRTNTDLLDAVGNTTKAVTKGYAIASAGLAAIVLFSSYIQDIYENVFLKEGKISAQGLFQMFSIADPYVVAGLFIGGLIPFLFSAFALEAVGKTATRVVIEIRKAFFDHPDILIGKEKPDYAGIVDIITKSSLKEMVIPALLPVIVLIFLLLSGKILQHWTGQHFISARLIGGMLTGSIVTGLFLAISMTFGGGAWDNAKKYIEEGRFGGKCSDAHMAAITGDTVGDPYKDTAGPAINPLIKVLNILALLLISLII